MSLGIKRRPRPWANRPVIGRRRARSPVRPLGANTGGGKGPKMTGLKTVGRPARGDRRRRAAQSAAGRSVCGVGGAVRRKVCGHDLEPADWRCKTTFATCWARRFRRRQEAARWRPDRATTRASCCCCGDVVWGRQRTSIRSQPDEQGCGDAVAASTAYGPRPACTGTALAHLNQSSQPTVTRINRTEIAFPLRLREGSIDSGREPQAEEVLAERSL